MAENQNNSIIKNLMASIQAAGAGKIKPGRAGIKEPEPQTNLLKSLISAIPKIRETIDSAGAAALAPRNAEAGAAVEEKDLDPVQQSVLKTVQKGVAQQAESALKQGADPKSILAQSGIPTQGTPNPENVQNTKSAQIPSPFFDVPLPDQEDIKQVVDDPTKRSLLNRLLLSVGAALNPSMAPDLIRILDNENQRRFESKEALIQAGIDERQAIGKKQDEFFENILTPKPLSAEASKTLDFIESGLSDLSKLETIFNKDPKLLRNANRKGNTLGQQIRILTESLANNIVRKESGAAITDDERKFARSMVPGRGLEAFLEEPRTAALKIRMIRERLERQRNGLKPNESMNAFVKQALSEGKSREEIHSFLRQAGKIP